MVTAQVPPGGLDPFCMELIVFKGFNQLISEIFCVSLAV